MKLYDALGARALDQLASDEFGLDSRELMERAGVAAFDSILDHWPGARRLWVVCGSGNNAGDGYVVARLARQAGLTVTVFQVIDPASLSDTARHNYDAARALGIEFVVLDGSHSCPFSERLTALGEDSQPDVIVDAIFGTGLSRSISSPLDAQISDLNSLNVPRLALDIPSGIKADSGGVAGTAIRADVTVTFICGKPGLLTGQGPAYVGRLESASLGVPARAFERVASAATAFDFSTAAAPLRNRDRTAHKGTFGHVLIVGGYEGMGGAALIAAEAAARTGAGLISVATWPSHVAAFISRLPNVMTKPATGMRELDSLLPRATVLALGPGLGRAPWGEHLFDELIGSEIVAVIDADALNMLSERPSHRDDWILTPHPGEAARLLKISTRDVEANRIDAAKQIATRFGGICVLKGAGTVVTDGAEVYICSGGNPGMASGGMGDALCGIIAALLAQTDVCDRTSGSSRFIAARLGVALHAAAADRTAQRIGERGMVATDLFSELPGLMSGRE